MFHHLKTYSQNIQKKKKKTSEEIFAVSERGRRVSDDIILLQRILFKSETPERARTAHRERARHSALMLVMMIRCRSSRHTQSVLMLLIRYHTHPRPWSRLIPRGSKPN